MTPDGRRTLEVARFACSTLADCLGRYGYVDYQLRPSAYVVSQMNGAYYWLPDLIGSHTPLRTPADREAWFSRLAALGTALDQESERIRSDAAQGVTPPGFVIDRTLAQLAQLRDQPASASALIAPAAVRARAAGLGEITPQAERIFAASVAPALTRQIAALQALRASAVETAGVWRLPDGDGYYAAALRANTTVETGPQALHEQGLGQVQTLSSALDASLRAQGFTSGPVGARIRALNDDPRFRVSEDDAGRARLMALARSALDVAMARLPRAFSDPRVDPIVVERVPAAVQAGAPAAFYEEGGVERPGAFMLNLGRPADYPTWRLPTLAHHEGVPGHHFQYGVARRQPALPLVRRLFQFSAYTEGWALYAEQVADEIGCYQDDPFGRIGYLQSELFRAGRIVVDTGIHHRRWTREQAVQWMVANVGETEAAARREIDRYCVYPGQACSFKVGANAIVEARVAARMSLGSRFDVRAFHDQVLDGGGVPMSVLQAEVRAWSLA